MSAHCASPAANVPNGIVQNRSMNARATLGSLFSPPPASRTSSGAMSGAPRARRASRPAPAPRARRLDQLRSPSWPGIRTCSAKVHDHPIGRGAPRVRLLGPQVETTPRRRTDSDGAIMSRRPSCKVANTRRDPSPGRPRWRSSDGSQKPCAQCRLLSIGRVDLTCTGRRRAAAARQPILQRCARATTMQPYAPPSSASSSLERRSRSSLPRGWRTDDQNSHPDPPVDAASPHRRREIVRRPHSPLRHASDENRSARGPH